MFDGLVLCSVHSRERESEEGGRLYKVASILLRNPSDVPEEAKEA